MTKKTNNAIIITGCASGLGNDLCKIIKKKNSKIKIIGIDKNLCKLDIDEFFKIDLSDNKLLSGVIKKIDKKYSVKYIINVAAILKLKKFDQLRQGDLQEHFQTNVIAIFNIVHKLRQNLIKNKAVVLNIGSIHSKLTKKNFLPYSVSKNALNGLTKSLAQELIGKVKVNIVNLGPMNTPMLLKNLNVKKKAFFSNQPSKQILSPTQAGKFIYKIIDTFESEYFTGMEINLDGGYNSLLKDS